MFHTMALSRRICISSLERLFSLPRNCMNDWNYGQNGTGTRGGMKNENMGMGPVQACTYLVDKLIYNVP